MKARGKKTSAPVFYGFDLGTGGLTGQVRNQAGRLLAEAKAGYGYGESQVMPGFPQGVMLHNPADWERAMRQVGASLKRQLVKLGVPLDNAYVGLAGQMHGLVCRNDKESSPEPAPLWCDDRDAAEAAELTELLDVKIAQRFTVSRWLGKLRRQKTVGYAYDGFTTPGGWIFYRLTGEWAVGIGEASGMFPVKGGGFDREKMDRFDDSLGRKSLGLNSLMPQTHQAGQFVGALNGFGAEMLGLPVGTKVAPPEGDQQGALTGSLIGRPGDAALSVGTSVVLNVLSDKAFPKISAAIDPFVDAAGQPFYMIWVKNGTTFLNLLMGLFAQARGDRKINKTFQALMPQAEKAAKKSPDCGGMNGLPFIINEPGAGFSEKGLTALFGLSPKNLTPGNLLHLSFLLPLFGVRNGMEELAAEGINPARIIVTGGIAQSPSYAGPVIADVLNKPVFIPAEATEGTAFGAALLAMFAWEKESRPSLAYQQFLAKCAKGREGKLYRPNPKMTPVYDSMRRRFKRLQKACVCQVQCGSNSAI